jgi:energy-coupling factor transport system substrate-specific component
MTSSDVIRGNGSVNVKDNSNTSGSESNKVNVIDNSSDIFNGISEDSKVNAKDNSGYNTTEIAKDNSDYNTKEIANGNAKNTKSGGNSNIKSNAKNRLKPKDLINIGIFTAIFFVIVFAVSFVGYIPIFIPALAALCPLAGGIPFMLLVTKVRKFGAMLIMIILVGLVYILVGGISSWILPIGIVTGLIAELIVKSGGYKSAKKAIIAYGVWSIAIFGNFVPAFFTRDAYYQVIIASGYGQEYADAYMSFMPDWIAPILVLACFVFGCLGAIIGRAVLKKHFVRAGMA